MCVVCQVTRLSIEIKMMNSKYENFSIQRVEPPTPDIINFVFEEIEDKESSEFNKSDGMDIFPSLPELNSVPTLTTSFWDTTSTVRPSISESGDPAILDLLRNFEPTSLPYSLVTTHTSDHCHFGTFYALCDWKCFYNSFE